MEVIYLNCGWRPECESDLRSNEHYLSSSEKKAWKNLHGCIWNQHHDQLPVGLLAQLAEHCIGIAEVMGSNPVQAWTFFRPSFHYYLSSIHYCEDRFRIHCKVLMIKLSIYM